MMGMRAWDALQAYSPCCSGQLRPCLQQLGVCRHALPPSLLPCTATQPAAMYCHPACCHVLPPSLLPCTATQPAAMPCHG